MKVYQAFNIVEARRDPRLTPVARLILEVVNIMPGIDRRELDKHLNEIVDHYGSVEEALKGFERGEVGAERMQ